MERQELKPSPSYSMTYLSQSRGAVMGVATVLIVCLHVYQIFGLAGGGALYTIKDIVLHNCEYGVDIFLFVSGFGLYCSLSRGIKLRSYICRRLLRIYPEYIITIAVLFLLIQHIPIKNVLFQLVGINLFVYQDLTLWYVPLIVILYLIYPIIHRLAEKTQLNIWIMMVLYIIADLVFIYFFGMQFGLMQIITDRVPVFLLGVWAGRYYKKDNRPIPFTICLCIFLAGVVAFVSLAFLGHYEHYRFAYLIMAVAASVLISMISVKLGEKNILNKLMSFIGSISYQIYLIHGLLTIIIVEKTPILKIPNKNVWIVVTLSATFLSAIALKLICDQIRKVALKAK